MVIGKYATQVENENKNGGSHGINDSDTVEQTTSSVPVEDDPPDASEPEKDHHPDSKSKLPTSSTTIIHQMGKILINQLNTLKD